MSLTNYTDEQLKAELAMRAESVKIPSGWTLMNSHHLVNGVHEVFDPDDPSAGWQTLGHHSDTRRQLADNYGVLLVARRRKDNE